MKLLSPIIKLGKHKFIKKPLITKINITFIFYRWVTKTANFLGYSRELLKPSFLLCPLG